MALTGEQHSTRNVVAAHAAIYLRQLRVRLRPESVWVQPQPPQPVSPVVELGQRLVRQPSRCRADGQVAGSSRSSPIRAWLRSTTPSGGSAGSNTSSRATTWRQSNAVLPTGTVNVARSKHNQLLISA